MKQLQEGDLIAIEASGKYYYALILSKIRLFGGNWTYVFHRCSDPLLPLEKVLTMPISGFNAFVDFIWAKREKRITCLARKLDTSGFQGPGRLKATHATKAKAPFWFIMDMNFKELKRVTHLTDEEARYPDNSRIDDTIMVERVNTLWKPENYHRI